MLRKLREFLNRERVRYDVMSHPRAYTSEGVAAAQHVPGRDLAKVLIAKAGGRFVMAVLPATSRIDLHKLGDLTGDPHTVLASEAEFAKLFPGCEVGAMPPFGNLYDVPVFADPRLAEDESIVFEAGSHTETVRLAWTDFERLVRPTQGDLTLMHEDV
jgi:Ala-tRNA(Pro) deacylase